MDNLDPALVEISEAEYTPRVSTGSLWRMAFRRLFRQRSARIGTFLLGALILIAIFARQIAPFDPNQILIGVEDVVMREPPCIHLLGCTESEPQHILGTDSLARDFFSRIVYGTRVSLFMGISAVGLAFSIGTILGAIAGYSGGWWNTIIMRVMDVLLAFPGLLLALVVVAYLGPGLENTFIAIAVVQIPHYARITRGSVLSLKETAFVKASQALGGGYFHILLNRILPNTLTPLIVKATLGVASAILDAAALSFLGFGPSQSTPEWGAILGFEYNSMFNAPYLVIFPGIAIVITVLAFNLLGEGLRDALDPRLTYFDSGPGAVE
jgi:ABC-type dipeptide/oligopeptide/nickel transport system permease subunit